MAGTIREEPSELTLAPDPAPARARPEPTTAQRFAEGVAERIDRRRFFRKAARSGFMTLAVLAAGGALDALVASPARAGCGATANGLGCPTGGHYGTAPCGPSRCCSYIRSGYPSTCNCGSGGSCTSGTTHCHGRAYYSRAVAGAAPVPPSPARRRAATADSRSPAVTARPVAAATAAAAASPGTSPLSCSAAPPRGRRHLSGAGAGSGVAREDDRYAIRQRPGHRRLGWPARYKLRVRHERVLHRGVGWSPPEDQASVDLHGRRGCRRRPRLRGVRDAAAAALAVVAPPRARACRPAGRAGLARVRPAPDPLGPGERAGTPPDGRARLARPAILRRLAWRRAFDRDGDAVGARRCGQVPDARIDVKRLR